VFSTRKLDGTSTKSAIARVPNDATELDSARRRESAARLRYSNGIADTKIKPSASLESNKNGIQLIGLKTFPE
jgi:hypothetical protein